MSTTDQILGSRDTQFPTVGQPTGMSSKYYTLVDTRTSPATSTIKERSPLGNMFDRSVGTIQGGKFTNIKGNASEQSFFSNPKTGMHQANNAARGSSVEDLYTNNNPHFPGTQGNSEAVLNATNKSFQNNQGTEEQQVKIGSGAQNVSELAGKIGNIPDAAGTRNNFEGPNGALIFPTGLGNTTQDAIFFKMKKFRPKKLTNPTQGKFGTEDRSDGETIGRVVLPIPGGIQDTNSVTWGQDSMDALQIELANIALKTIDDIGTGVDATRQAIDTLANNSGEAGTAVKAALAGMAVGKNNLLSRTTGAILNPNMELLFQGPTLRPFAFSFQLAPRNKDEAKTVISIIRFFKQGMAPIRTKSNLFLKSPHTFQLEYKYRGGNKSESHPYLNKFKECALQGCAVNYTPNGNYSTFSDGVMMSYQLTLSFSELEPIFNDEYGSGYDNIGY